MLKLRELTADQHKVAERQGFAKKLLSGKIDTYEYVTYLYNMGFIYNTLENIAWQAGVLEGIESIRRADKIWTDYEELLDGYSIPPMLNITDEYCEYFRSIRNEPSKLLAHIYVRHMGDMAGGQMIAKKIPGKGRFYEFEDVESLKLKLREKLNNDMADEAKIAFDFATDLFVELDNIDDLESFSRDPKLFRE
ncbi:MAG: biliverdin-producing heme oxygenase [Candidatus Poseidoniales archaeon]